MWVAYKLRVFVVYFSNGCFRGHECQRHKNLQFSYEKKNGFCAPKQSKNNKIDMKDIHAN